MKSVFSESHLGLGVKGRFESSLRSVFPVESCSAWGCISSCPRDSLKTGFITRRLRSRCVLAVKEGRGMGGNVDRYAHLRVSPVTIEGLQRGACRPLRMRERFRYGAAARPVRRHHRYQQGPWRSEGPVFRRDRCTARRGCARCAGLESRRLQGAPARQLHPVSGVQLREELLHRLHGRLPGRCDRHRGVLHRDQGQLP